MNRIFISGSTIPCFLACMVLLSSCGQGKPEEEGGSREPGVRMVREYYPDGRLKSETEALGKLRHGEAREYRRDGTLEVLINYQNNRKHGPAMSFYPDGKTVKTDIPYQNGYKHGEAKWYYRDGKIYRRTPYVRGRIEGTRVVYYENGNVQAEIPYRKGQPGIGLKEYTLKGDPKTLNVEIVFREKDRISLDNTFQVIISLSDGSRGAEFFRGKLTEGIYWNDQLTAIPTENGTGVLEFYISRGNFRMETLNIVARDKTSLNNPLILQRAYHLAIENKF